MLTEIDDQKGGGLPQKGRGYAIAAGILGWTLDAFDFFVVVFLVDTLAGPLSGRKKRNRFEHWCHLGDCVR